MRRATIGFCSLAILAGCGGPAAPESVIQTTPEATPFLGKAESVLVRFEGATVTAEVVADGASRQLGLMHRTELADDAGMLFLFPRPDSGGFWMKNTLIPLQIAYMRKTGPGTYEVLALRDMVPCTEDPCMVYDPGVPYDAALEVNEGWFDRHDVVPGSAAVTEGGLPDPI